MKAKILVVGSLNMDLVVYTPRHPQIGETLIGGRFATFPGGKGANQAVAAARMGGQTMLIGRVGRDGFGAELVQVAAADGIDTACIGVDDQAASGVALITVDEKGQNTIVVASGANFYLSPAHIQAAEAAFDTAQVLVLQLETPLESVAAAAALAAKHGVKVVLNPAPAQALSRELLAQVDYLIPNEREAMQLAGQDTLEAAVDALLLLGVRHLIVTLGERGVLIADRSGRQHIPAYKVQAVDSVAAGDAFVGAFAVGLAEGLTPVDAAALGNAAAAISVTRPGAQPSLPYREEVDAFIQAANERNFHG